MITALPGTAPVRNASSATLTSESGHVVISGSRTLCEATREMSSSRSSRRPERTPLIVASLWDTSPKSKSGTARVAGQHVQTVWRERGDARRHHVWHPGTVDNDVRLSGDLIEGADNGMPERREPGPA